MVVVTTEKRLVKEERTVALGILLIFYIILFVIAFICLTLLWVVKKERFDQIMIWICAVFSLLVAYTSASALPSNYMTLREIAWGFGALAGVSLWFHHKHQVVLAKLLMSLSISLGIIQLFFF